MQSALLHPFFLTSVGKKYLMAVTGLIWAGFVMSHMAGNLIIFLGSDAYNSYGHAIVSNPLLIPAEIFLALAFVTHVGLAVLLTIENKAAKGTRYAVAAKAEKGGSLASRTMAVQGSLVLFFLISHLLTFKFGSYYETTVNGVVMRDLYRLLLECFHNPGFVSWYVVAVIILGFHLSHGVGSIFQSLGLKNDHYIPLISKFSTFYGVVVTAGFLSQPLYVYFFAG